MLRVSTSLAAQPTGADPARVDLSGADEIAGGLDHLFDQTLRRQC